MSGRANAALNLLHVGGAFVLQSATGFIIAQWPEARGTYPAEAHQTAMATTLVLQLAALAWFASCQRRLPAPAMARAASRSLAGRRMAGDSDTPYTTAAAAWTQHLDLVRKQAMSWRFAAVGSAMLCLGLTAALSTTINRPAVAVHILEVDRSAHVSADRVRSSVAALIDDPPALELARSAEGPLWRAPDLMRSVFVQPQPIVRPSPRTMASSVKAQR